MLPVDKEHDVYTILGVILCLRHVMPHLSKSVSPSSQGLKDSFGYREQDKEEGVSNEQLLKVNFTSHFHVPTTLPFFFVWLKLAFTQTVANSILIHVLLLITAANYR